MHRTTLPVLTALLLTLAAAPMVQAQGDVSAASVAQRDSVFKRARRMVIDGNGASGRALVDSLLKRSEEGSASYGDALYWHGALAATAAEAERDYRRVIVEYPLSHYADDALLAIVELEQARGDRVSALAHLQRFVREHPPSTARGTAALAAARLAFEQRDNRVGCSLISDARASISAGDVELRNQIDYFGTRCANVALEASSTPAAPSTAVATTVTKVPARDTAVVPQAQPKKSASTTVPSPPLRTEKPPTKVDVATTPAPNATTKPAKPVDTPPTAPAAKAAPRGNYTIQLAAYATRADADRLVAKLAKSGVSARVSGTAKPFRVRLDFYPTRQAAQEEVAALKERGIIGFVTTETPAPERRTP